jgi:hypothetical protein
LSAANVIKYLRRFNRKERFLLVGWALGNEAFVLGQDFRILLGDELRLTIPADAFVAMDYHLDWLYASLVLGTEGGEDESQENPRTVDRTDGSLGLVIAATQEDVDLIIAFQDGGACHIIIVEAKGVTGWTNKQMESKADRLRTYFKDGKMWPNVTPHFVIVSPRRYPEGLNVSGWPIWMKKDDKHAHFVQMPPLADRLLRVTRWDDGEGKASRHGDRWKAVDA